MANKGIGFIKAFGFFAVIMTVAALLTCYADPETENTESSGADIKLRSEAPVYTGPAQEGDLKELTVEDFEAFGDESESPKDQYRRYRNMLEEGVLGAPVLYRLRIIDRDLALDDFQGFGVSEELAQARYDGYLSMIPATADGRTIHYVYVYHRPLARTVSETPAN